MVSFTHKKKVRLHIRDGAPSIEGILAGRTKGHYIIWSPRVLESEEASVSVLGHVEVPERNVMFVQVLS